MRFSDSSQFGIPKPTENANSDSSSINSDESLSDEDSSQKLIIPPTTFNYRFKIPSSNDSSPIKLYDNSHFKQKIKTPQTDIPIDTSRQPSQDQSNLLPPPLDRTTKTQNNHRHQPKIDYRRFIPLSKL